VTLKQIIIKAKQAVNNHQIGTHNSSLKSNGYDFVELREYIDGEDIKQINWTISAKMQKPYIKVFHDSKKLNIIVASMLDEGILFGTKNTKKNTIANIVAILGFSAIKQCDLFSHYIFTNTKQHFTKPTTSINNLKNIIDSILKFKNVNQKSDYLNMEKILFKEIKQKSMIFLIGDFFNEIDLKLLSIKHQVICIIVRDIYEEKPTKIDNIHLLNKANNINQYTNINQQSIKTYHKQLKLNDDNLIKQFHKYNIKYTKIYTNEEPILKPMKLF
jgi:uncharacterized protein (DUF58 family)